MAVWLAALAPACATNLVTGNGFGFAVVAPETGAVTKFYAHPYSFAREDEKNPLSEGVATANFIKALEWGADGGKVSAEYEQDSHVIHIRGARGNGFVWMPFGLRRAVVIVDWEPEGRPTGLRVEWSAPVQSRSKLPTANSDAEILKIEGIDEHLLLIPLEGREANPDESGAVLRGSTAWALVTVTPGEEPKDVVTEFQQWRGGLSPRALEQREITKLERWRVDPHVHFASEQERHLWRQSEVMLRMAQSREPNRAGRYGNGLIVASLPDGVWFTPWVRDMAWATVALARMGHRAEARAAVLAYFNARPTGKMRARDGGRGLPDLRGPLLGRRRGGTVLH